MAVQTNHGALEDSLRDGCGLLLLLKKMDPFLAFLKQRRQMFRHCVSGKVFKHHDGSLPDSLRGGSSPLLCSTAFEGHRAFLACLEQRREMFKHFVKKAKSTGTTP